MHSPPPARQPVSVRSLAGARGMCLHCVSTLYAVHLRVSSCACVKACVCVLLDAGMYVRGIVCTFKVWTGGRDDIRLKSQPGRDLCTCNAGRLMCVVFDVHPQELSSCVIRCCSQYHLEGCAVPRSTATALGWEYLYL